MNVLLIDPMGVMLSEREKYHELSKFDDVNLAVAVPSKWKFNFKLFDAEKDDGVSAYKLTALKAAFRGYGHRSFFFSTLRSLLKKNKPDIIHLFVEPYSILAAQVTLARNLFYPKAKIIFITWENIFFASPPFVGSRLYDRIEKFVYRHSAGATPITKSALGVLKKKGYDKPYKVMGWGINLERFRTQNAIDLKHSLGLENKFVVGYVGRFVEEKGVLDLVKAVSSLNHKVALLLIGDGPLKSQIENLATANGLRDRVVFVDSISNTEMNRYLNCMDALVLPSRDSRLWKEQLGKVLLEAMACEVPVIGSDSGEIPNVIGDAGKIFRAGDAQDLKEKIKEVMIDSNGLLTLKKKAKERVHQIYSWRSIAGALHDFYHAILQA